MAQTVIDDLWPYQSSGIVLIIIFQTIIGLQKQGGGATAEVYAGNTVKRYFLFPNMNIGAGPEQVMTG